MSTQTPPVTIERRGKVLVMTLDRGASGNAIDDGMAAALREACQQAIEDDESTVVLLLAAGEAFCLGAAPMTSPLTQIAARRVADAIASIPKLVIAAIQGDAIGQGLELSLACDLRLAADTACFAMDQVQEGLIPWDGGTQRLPRAVPKGIALEMVLTGKPITAEDALTFGLVSECLPLPALRQRALDLAEQLAALAPIAAAYTKEAVLRGMDAPLDQGIRLEADLAVLLHTTQDRAEGIRSFLEKRKPRFTGS